MVVVFDFVLLVMTNTGTESISPPVPPIHAIYGRLSHQSETLLQSEAISLLWVKEVFGGNFDWTSKLKPCDKLE